MRQLHPRIKPGQLVACMLFFSAAWALAATALPDDPDKIKFFEMEVRPLLAENCYKCHGPAKQKGGLRLDHVSLILTGGERGPALEAGKPETSLIIKAVNRVDPDFEMPPDDKLPPDKIATLKKWIAMGAPWPQGETPTKPARVPGVITPEDRQWWAFQPVRKSALPTNGAVNPVDAFVKARLQQEGLKPAPPADRAEWVRRVYFDLHGLPPTPEEVKAFVNDKEANAEARLLDRLLASPRYGERWAQHWLDLVRYAESDGYRADGYRANAWPYRDYVIRSFNQDKSYDRFVKEQLAGDELAPEDPDAVIGTAFLRHSIYEWNQRDVVGQWTGILNEVTDVTADVFLGMSVQCARCHDHKFDPIMHKDYYRLQSFFSPLAWPEDKVLATPEAKKQYAEKQLAWEEATKEIRAEIESIIGPSIAAAEKKARDIFPEDIQAMFAKAAPERTPREEQLVQLASRQVALERPKFKDTSLPKAEQAKLKSARARLAAFDGIKPKPLARAFVAADVAATSSPTTFTSRKKGAQTVTPGFLTILDETDAVITAPTNGVNSTGRRTALAQWITSPTNPLTARVLVNRVWQFHFGKGLASSASDFGRLGEKPTHPELLDWLAAEFMANGYHLKPLHKLIMTSETYRQTARRAPSAEEAKKDPENRLLWRFSPKRLDAEEARDAILLLSGELDLKMGGPSVEASVPRRSIYTKKLRNSPDAFLSSLDAPPGFSSVPARESTTTPMQALLFVNGEWPMNRARAMSRRLTGLWGTNDSEIAVKAWQLALSRIPTVEEKKKAQTFLSQQLAEIVRNAPVPVSYKAPVADSKNYMGDAFLANMPGQTFVLQPGSPKEKLRVPAAASSDGEGFTIESVVYLESLTQDAGMFTIASRWNGGKSEKGWALGVSGSKSSVKPGSLVLEINGEDFQASMVNEMLDSGFSIPLRKPYYVAASVSYQPQAGRKFGGVVTFFARDLSVPDAPLQTMSVTHEITTSLNKNDFALCVGGRDRNGQNLWNGGIARVSMRSGLLDSQASPRGESGEAVEIVAPRLEAMLKAPADKGWRWDTSAIPAIAAADAPSEALADLCHALLNSNEFLYLH